MSPARLTVGLSLALALGTAPARADRRTMIRAYEYQTEPRGNLEFELWNTIQTPRSRFSDSVLVQRAELAYGITDQWDVALYHVFERGGPPADFHEYHLTDWQLQARYRPEKGALPVDLVVFLQIERPVDLGKPFAVEERLILEKVFGPIAVVANVAGKQHPGGADRGRSWEVDLGARYEFAPQLRVAAEFWTTHEFVGPDVSRNYYLGPSLSVASSKVWLQIGAGIGLDVAQDERMQIRFVLGFNL